MRDELKRLIRKPIFWIYIMAAVIFFVCWFFPAPIIFKISSVILYLIMHLIFGITNRTQDSLIEFIKWSLFTVIFLLAAAYINMACYEEIVIPTEVYLIVAVLLYLGLCVFQMSGIYNSKSIWWLLPNYIIFIITFNIVFGLIYAYLSTLNGNGLIWLSGKPEIINFWTYVYFSIQVFYSNSSGDITACGISTIIISVELLFSAIIHVIVLGLVINKLPTLLCRQPAKES